MRNCYLLLLIITLFSCNSKKTIESKITPSVDNFPNTVMYEIFVQSFADSDGDGIGDIKGMTSRLDYLQELGIGGIWLMPIMPSPSYHKYDVTDYRDIHPDYGTMEDFKEFISEAHKRDIKVIIDMIINHSSDRHPWFIESKSGRESKYRNFYVWASEEEIEKISSREKEATGDSDNRYQWHGDSLFQEKYYGFFSGMMPDLNYDNPEVKDGVIDISRFWTEEIGVDGFRLDAAKHIFEDSRVSDSKEWWDYYRSEMTKIKPDIYLVGEVWADTETVLPFVSGFPALFDFDLAFSILASVKEESSKSTSIKGPSWVINDSLDFVEGYLLNQQKYEAIGTEFYDATFLSNHDQNRVMSVLKNNKEKARLAATILLTLPGTPYLYYGEEIGMRGMKPDENIREPMIWSLKNDSMRTHWLKPEHTTTETVVPVAKQLTDSVSLLSHYKNLTSLRNTSQALTYGELQNFYTPEKAIIAYTRVYKEEKVLVLHNLSVNEIELTLPDEYKDYVPVMSADHSTPYQNGVVLLKGYASVVLSNVE